MTRVVTGILSVLQEPFLHAYAVTISLRRSVYQVKYVCVAWQQMPCSDLAGVLPWPLVLLVACASAHVVIDAMHEFDLTVLCRAVDSR